MFCRLLNPDVGDLMKQAPGAIDIGNHASFITAALDYTAVGILLAFDQVVVHFLAHGMNHLAIPPFYSQPRNQE